ncbi:hypothetical protein [Pseudarthrobacter oxydans]|uniref:hypothetical protein n=1 Tax=Pseudarthrobacter oxydans TaxID=1671 RepID=UPI0035E65776
MGAITPTKLLGGMGLIMPEATSRRSLVFRTLMPARFRVLLALVGLAVVSVLLITTPWPGLAVVMAGVLAAAMMMTVRIRLEDTCVSIRVAGVFGTTIAYNEISVVSLGPTTGIIEGMGLRLLPGEGLGYLVGGPSICIRSGKSTIIASSAAPEEVIARIRERRTE